MRDPKMILVIEEERQAAVLENDRLRAELASRQIDIDTFREGNQKLRAELAAEAIYMRQAYMEIEMLRAELAAKDLIIANLNERSAQYERDSVAKDARIADAQQDCADARSSLRETDEELAATALDLKAANARIAELESLRPSVAEIERDEAIARAERAEARIAELERHLKNSGMYGNAGRYWEGRWREADARIAELEAYHTNCTDHINQLLGNMADDDKERVAILARAERAEAELIPLKMRLSGAESQRDGLLAFVGKVEAERDAIREVLEPFVKVFMEQPLAEIRHSRDDYRKARAALAPSPAGREG